MYQSDGGVVHVSDTVKEDSVLHSVVCSSLDGSDLSLIGESHCRDCLR